MKIIIEIDEGSRNIEVIRNMFGLVFNGKITHNGKLIREFKTYPKMGILDMINEDLQEIIDNDLKKS